MTSQNPITLPSVAFAWEVSIPFKWSTRMQQKKSYPTLGVRSGPPKSACKHSWNQPLAVAGPKAFTLNPPTRTFQGK